jgi:hypothetical protein
MRVGGDGMKSKFIFGQPMWPRNRWSVPERMDGADAPADCHKVVAENAGRFLAVDRTNLGHRGRNLSSLVGSLGHPTRNSTSSLSLTLGEGSASHERPDPIGSLCCQP